MKETRTNVLRLTDSEMKLIEVARKFGLNEIGRELNFLMQGNEISESFTGLNALRLEILNQGNLNAENLIEMNVANRAQIEHMLKQIKEYKNIVVSGYMGSGKTTVLEVLLTEVATRENFLENVSAIGYYCCEDSSRLFKDLSRLNFTKIENVFAIPDHIKMVVYPEVKTVKDVQIIETLLLLGLKVCFTIHGELLSSQDLLDRLEKITCDEFNIVNILERLTDKDTAYILTKKTSEGQRKAWVR